MHPEIYKAFDKILSGKEISGPVLEVGAIPDEQTLLNLPILQNFIEKIGINLEGPFSYKDFIFHQINANKMDIFSDNYFGVVLCNAMLEHDKYFWKTIAEIRRVTKPGGLVVIGTPGYTINSFQKFRARFSKYSWYRKMKLTKTFNFLLSSTLTLEVHGDAYGDYYRFSQAAYRQVFFIDYKDVEIIQVLQPPRIIGLGIKTD